MVIDFDKYKSGESIIIIKNGISKIYTDPIVRLSYNKCFPPTKTMFIEIEITGEYVLVENSITDKEVKK